MGTYQRLMAKQWTQEGETVNRKGCRCVCVCVFLCMLVEMGT